MKTSQNDQPVKPLEKNLDITKFLSPTEYGTSEINKEVIYSSDETTASNDLEKSLRIIHFNDVYDIEGDTKNEIGGAARFSTAIKYLRDQGPCIALFSGDAFSPSALSLITKGKQMIPVLNHLDISAACIGNHDLDFGVDELISLTHATNFPWLLSNVLDIEHHKPLGNSHSKIVIDFNGVKLGIIGLAEPEWLETLSTIDFHDVIYDPFVEIGRDLARELRDEHKVDYVIALTHMRAPNDILLAKEVDGIDLILGGHDHHKFNEFINEKWVIKSGTDFKSLSLIEVEKRSNEKFQVTKIESYDIDSKFREDEVVSLIVEDFNNLKKENFNKVLGSIDTELDGRFLTVRSEESKLGNFISDIVKASVNADCTIINSGTLRSDCVFPPGEFTLGDLNKIIMFPDPIVLLSCTGTILHEALENSISKYPKLEGRFPLISGIQFAFDPTKPPGSRIDPRTIKIKNEYLDNKKDYKLAVKSYLKEGKDGFQMLKDCPVFIDEEDGPILFTLIENHFLQTKLAFKRRNSTAAQFAEYEQKTPKIKPILEERIICINDPKVLDDLLQKRADFNNGIYHRPRSRIQIIMEQ